MISKLFTLVTLTVFAQAAVQDAGFFAGLRQGIFMIDEEALEKNGCKVPEEPAMFEQAKAMIPMAKMMAQNMNNGVVPAYVVTLEKALH